MINQKSNWKLFRMLLEGGFVYTAAEFWTEAFLRATCEEAEPPEQFKALGAFLSKASPFLKNIRTNPDYAEFDIWAHKLASLPMMIARRFADWMTWVEFDDEIDPESKANVAKCRQVVIDLLGDENGHVFDELMRQARARRQRPKPSSN